MKEQRKLTSLSKTALSNYMIIFVGISGCFSVLFGAWMSHSRVHLPPSVQSNLATALEYQFLHTLALLSTLVWLKSGGNTKLLLAASCAFIFGILAFSGVIYIKSFFELSMVGKLTPVGGLSFAVGWLLLAVAGKKNI